MSAAARTGFLNAFKNKGFHIGPRSLRSQGISLEGVKPIYDCVKVPWWARWTYFLVMADLVVTASTCELTWNHWTTWEALPDDQQPPKSPTQDQQDESEVLGHYVRRPWWQRGLFVTTTLTAGIGLAAVLLIGRSRVARRMFIIPRPGSLPESVKVGGHSPDRSLVIQSPLHPKNHGAVYPLNRTTLVNNSEASEMMVGLMDDRGHYSVGLKGAEVGGVKLSPWDARKSLFAAWYGEKKGAQMLLDSAKVKETA